MRVPGGLHSGTWWWTRACWLVPAAGVLALADGVLRPPAEARPVDRVSFAVLMALIAWFGWLVAQTGLAVDADGLRVTNFGRFRRIPWSAIESVREDREVVVALRSGRTVRLLGGGGSLLGTILGSIRQRDLAELVDRHRAAGGAAPAKAVHGWRLHLRPAVAATAVIAAVAWLHG